MTAMGMIIGTAAYMSPEQARGKVVDKRADIDIWISDLASGITSRVTPDPAQDSDAGQVYVRSFPGPGDRTLVSNERDLHPRWRADGREFDWKCCLGRLLFRHV